MRRSLVHGVDERNESEPLRRADAARRYPCVVKARGPGLARSTDRDGEADVLHRPQAGTERARLLERLCAESRRGRRPP